jgi:hypothetical protein
MLPELPLTLFGSPGPVAGSSDRCARLARRCRRCVRGFPGRGFLAPVSDTSRGPFASHRPHHWQARL